MSQPIQRTVQFYDDELIAVQEPASGAIYVPLTRLCDNLGIQRYRQAQRIQEDPVLQHGLVVLSVQTDGGVQPTQGLRLDLIPLWLAKVNANRVRAEVREKLILYQTEVAAVLWSAFKHDILPADEPSPPAPMSGAQVAYELATAVQHLARQQLEFEQRFGQRMDTMARFLGDFVERTDHRLASIELHLSPQATITDEQAAEVALAVKNVGQALAARGAHNGYQQVYGELYRRYKISSYQRLPQAKLRDVLDWLHGWYVELHEAGPAHSST